MNQTEIRKTFMLVVVGIVLLIASLTLPPMITGNSKLVSLSSGSTFSGQISQYLGIPDGKKDLAVEGEDYAIETTAYFANKSWAVVHFKALTDRVAEGGYAIFEQKNGMHYYS
jgi:hypothetical protein